MEAKAGLGIRMHSGWGVLVAVSQHGEVLDRQRIVVVAEDFLGGKMPFHHAEHMSVEEAEAYLKQYRKTCEALALTETKRVVSDLRARGFLLKSAGMVLASGKPLPALENILASHALIHTAEGELFRNCVSKACECNGLQVFGYRERELPSLADEKLGSAAVHQLLAAGKKLGPPWTSDHRSAALAGAMALQMLKAHRAAKAGSA